MATATRLDLTLEEAETLNRWIRSGSSEQRLVERARIILALGEGKTNQQVAQLLQTRTARVSKWRTRFAQKRIQGLHDAPRSGKPKRYRKSTEKRILEALDEPPPEGYAQWSGRRLAERLGDVSPHQVWRVLRRHGIHLQRRRSWCISTDPEFARKAADIVGLYLDPPENAVVLCLDEKPHIQALERAQGWLRLPNGKSLFGYNHQYKRHGTSTLFAALEIATGQVRTGHFQRRRRIDFLAFLNEVVAAYPGQQIHVVLDNLNIHKPKNDRWLQRHPQVYFHFTPTYASWLNQAEIWFSILSRQALQGASFTSPRQLRQAIDRFVQVHNRKAAPFHWTKRKVFPKELQQKYSDLCN